MRRYEINRIIKRIAAYYEADETINNIIPQDNSNEQFEYCVQSQNALTVLNDKSLNALKHLQYHSFNVGLSGETVSINNDQYIIE